MPIPPHVRVPEGPWRSNPYTLDNKVSLMPISHLLEIRGNRLDPQHLQELQQRLQPGLREPLILSFDPRENKYTLGEGNHRTEIYSQQGYTHLPVRGLRSGVWEDPQSGKRTMSHDFTPYKNENGYIPGDISPAHIGLPGYHYDPKESDGPPMEQQAAAKKPKKYKRNKPWYVSQHPGKPTARHTGLIRLPVDWLLTLSGMRGEDEVLTFDTPKVKRMVDIASDNAWQRENPVTLNVLHDGSVIIEDGNHRIRAAKLGGKDTFWCKVVYYGGGEDHFNIKHVTRAVEKLAREGIDVTAASETGPTHEWDIRLTNPLRETLPVPSAYHTLLPDQKNVWDVSVGNTMRHDFTDSSDYPGQEMHERPIRNTFDADDEGKLLDPHLPLHQQYMQHTPQFSDTNEIKPRFQENDFTKVRRTYPGTNQALEGLPHSLNSLEPSNMSIDHIVKAAVRLEQQGIISAAAAIANIAMNDPELLTDIMQRVKQNTADVPDVESNVTKTVKPPKVNITKIPKPQQVDVPKIALLRAVAARLIEAGVITANDWAIDEEINWNDPESKSPKAEDDYHFETKKQKEMENAVGKDYPFADEPTIARLLRLAQEIQFSDFEQTPSDPIENTLPQWYSQRNQVYRRDINKTRPRNVQSPHSKDPNGKMTNQKVTTDSPSDSILNQKLTKIVKEPYVYKGMDGREHTNNKDVPVGKPYNRVQEGLPPQYRPKVSLNWLQQFAVGDEGTADQFGDFSGESDYREEESEGEEYPQTRSEESGSLPGYERDDENQAMGRAAGQTGEWAGTCSRPGCKVKPAPGFKKCNPHLKKDVLNNQFKRRESGCSHCQTNPHKDWCRTQKKKITPEVEAPTATPDFQIAASLEDAVAFLMVFADFDVNKFDPKGPDYFRHMQRIELPGDFNRTNGPDLSDTMPSINPQHVTVLTRHPNNPGFYHVPNPQEPMDKQKIEMIYPTDVSKDEATGKVQLNTETAVRPMKDHPMDRINTNVTPNFTYQDAESPYRNKLISQNHLLRAAEKLAADGIDVFAIESPRGGEIGDFPLNEADTFMRQKWQNKFPDALFLNERDLPQSDTLPEHSPAPKMWPSKYQPAVEMSVVNPNAPLADQTLHTERVDGGHSTWPDRPRFRDLEDHEQKKLLHTKILSRNHLEKAYDELVREAGSSVLPIHPDMMHHFKQLLHHVKNTAINQLMSPGYDDQMGTAPEPGYEQAEDMYPTAALFTDKEHRQHDHIKKTEEEAGKSEEQADDIAWATVNKQKHEASSNKPCKTCGNPTDRCMCLDDTNITPVTQSGKPRTNRQVRTHTTKNKSPLGDLGNIGDVGGIGRL